MGLLTDFFIAREDEAIQYDTQPEKFPERHQLKGITAHELSLLWAILQGVEWDVPISDEFEFLPISDDERWINKFPERMCFHLENLGPREFASLAKAWAATEEMGGYPESAEEIIRLLAELAKKARESGQRLYLWGSV